MGSGRTGFSTGAGPVSFYTSLSGGRRSSGGRGRTGGGPSPAAYQRQVAAYQRQAARAERAAEAHRLAQAFQHILNLHRVEFLPASPPLAPAPQPPDRAAVYRRYEHHALAGIGLLKLAARAEARRQAAEWTEREVQRLWAEACAQQERQQRQLNGQWEQLCANEPDVVLVTLAAAFEDNEAPTAPVGVDGPEVSLAVLVPPVEGIVPERMPTTTSAGNLSLKKLALRDRAAYYKQFVAGQVLVTVRETFAVAPGAKVARVAVLRNDGQDSYGRPRISCILAARLERAALEGVRWDAADAVQIIDDTATEVVRNETGRTKELSPLGLSGEPAIRTLIEAVDVSELVSGGGQASSPHIG